MNDAPGLDLLRAGLKANPEMVAIMITGHPTVSSSMESLRAGAWDYLPKPFSATQLQVLVGRAAHIAIAAKESHHAQVELEREHGQSDKITVLGVSSSFLHIMDVARKVARSDASVFITFEPIVELRSAKVMGFEALTRGPEGTHLETPGMLFSKAEQVGLLFELDCLCRRVALEQASLLPRGSKLFLNCLPTAIGDPNLRDEGLRKSLEGAALRPTDLVLEISESESIENFGVFREVRDSCRELGIGIAIDDAGSGYASLEAIMEIAPDFVKTDLGLVRGIDTDPPRQQVLSALHGVAHGIGAVVIAEGIETEAELQVLRDLGIAYGQGYHFGGALSSRSESETES